MKRLSGLVVSMALLAGGCSHGLGGVTHAISDWAGASNAQSSNDRYETNLRADDLCLDLMRETLAGEFYGHYRLPDPAIANDQSRCRRPAPPTPPGSAVTAGTAKPSSRTADLALRYWNGRRAQIDIACGIVFSDLTDLQRGSRFVRNSTNMAIDSIVALSSIAGVGPDFVPVVSVSQIGFNNLHAEVEALVIISPDLGQLLEVVQQRQDEYVTSSGLPFTGQDTAFTIDQFPALERTIFGYQQLCMPIGLRAAMSDSLQATVDANAASSTNNITVASRRMQLDALIETAWRAPAAHGGAGGEGTPPAALTDTALFHLVWHFQLTGPDGTLSPAEATQLASWFRDNNPGLHRLLMPQTRPEDADTEALAPIRSALTGLVEAVPNVLERARTLQTDFRQPEPPATPPVLEGGSKPELVTICAAATNHVHQQVTTGALHGPQPGDPPTSVDVRDALEAAARQLCTEPDA